MNSFEGYIQDYLKLYLDLIKRLSLGLEDEDKVFGYVIFVEHQEPGACKTGN